MKFIFSIILLILLSYSAFAQTSLDHQISLVRQTANADREALVRGNMNFTSGESDQFWPLWRQYRAAKTANGDRLLALIRNFAAHYQEMDDMRANELLTDSFSVKMQNIVIKQNFAKKIALFLPAKKVLRVIQLENKMDAAVDMKLASEIPLVK